MARKTISFSIDEEIANRIETLFPEGKTGKTLSALLDAYEQKDVSSISTDSLQLLSLENEELKTKNEAVNAENKAMQIELQTSKQKVNEQNLLIAQLQSENCQKITISENEMVISMPEQIRKLLEKTAEKLSAKYQIEILPQDILCKMFIRYTVERYTQWFYPFVLADTDIFDITGKTVSEWKSFINR